MLATFDFAQEAALGVWLCSIIFLTQLQEFFDHNALSFSVVLSFILNLTA